VKNSGWPSPTGRADLTREGLNTPRSFRRALKDRAIFRGAEFPRRDFPVPPYCFFAFPQVSQTKPHEAGPRAPEADIPIRISPRVVQIERSHASQGTIIPIAAPKSRSRGGIQAGLRNSENSFSGGLSAGNNKHLGAHAPKISVRFG
jgi:hypothetical protein